MGKESNPDAGLELDQEAKYLAVATAWTGLVATTMGATNFNNSNLAIAIIILGIAAVAASIYMLKEL